MESASSASKKRKIPHDDDDEEEKIEKFYALIKSIREGRDRLILNNISSAEIMQKEAADHQSKTKKQKLEEEKQVVVWEPAFQREDFLEEVDKFKKPHVMSLASTSQSKEETNNVQKEEVKEELDLSLSL